MFFSRLLRLLVTFYIQQLFLFVNFEFFTGLKFHLNVNINFAISLSRFFLFMPYGAALSVCMFIATPCFSGYACGR